MALEQKFIKQQEQYEEVQNKYGFNDVNLCQIIAHDESRNSSLQPAHTDKQKVLEKITKNAEWAKKNWLNKKLSSNTNKKTMKDCPQIKIETAGSNKTQSFAEKVGKFFTCCCPMGNK